MPEERLGWDDCVSLTPRGKKLVEESVHLAEKTAKKHHKRARHHGVELDTLVSQAYMGLIRAAASWDVEQSPNGTEGWGPFAVQHINWYILRLWDNAHDSEQIKHCGQQFPDDAEAFLLIDREERAETPLDAVNEVETRLKRLKPMHRAVLMMVDGRQMKQVDVAECLGVTRTAVSYVLTAARRSFKLSQIAAVTGATGRLRPYQGTGDVEQNRLLRWVEDDPERHKQSFARARRKGNETNRRNCILSLTFGVVRSCAWYAVDHRNKTVTGPYRRQKEATGIAKKQAYRNGAAYGWPLLSEAQAEILAFLEKGPATRPEVLDAVKSKPNTAWRLLYKLEQDGLANVRPTAGKFKEWSITPKALGEKRAPVLAVKGHACRKYLDQGYTPIPARKIKEKSDAV
jgi:RNA polymerase sigma factor (sigma-70 family)